MEIYYDCYEVAFACSGFRIFDAEGYERRYLSRDRHALERGYYVVHWPEEIRIRRFDEHAGFFGPFKTRKEALAAVDSVKAFITCNNLSLKAEPESPPRLTPRQTAHTY